jgi:hypothetical protein
VHELERAAADSPFDPNMPLERESIGSRLSTDLEEPKEGGQLHDSPGV